MSSPFHEGEQRVQERLGVRDVIEPWARKVVRGHLPDEHRRFYGRLPFVVAAARDVHRDCADVLQRLFGIVPAVAQQEGADIEVAPGYDPGQWKLTGNVQGEPPFRGQVAHHGWKATKCELPEWSGTKAAEHILAPVEVELK